MNQLGTGLHDAELYEDALSVKEAELSMLRRVGGAQDHVIATQTNLAITYDALGRHEDAMRMLRDVYSGRLRLKGEEHPQTLGAANNYANTLLTLERFKEAKSLLRKTMPVARRVLGEGNDLTLKMKQIYARALYEDDEATLDDNIESVNRLEDAERTGRRVLGGAHPTTTGIENPLQYARAALRARETPPTSA